MEFTVKPSHITEFVQSGPPWLGDSHFNDKVDVKNAGARWDADSKKWKAVDEPTLIALMSGMKWRPLGHDSAFAVECVRYIHHRNQLSELAEQKKRKSKACGLSLYYDRLTRPSPSAPTGGTALNTDATGDLLIKRFLQSGPPWLGDSHFNDKVDVKNAGARWDADSKKWKAVDEPTLIALMSGMKWRPLGHERGNLLPLAFAVECVRYIHRRNQLSELAKKGTVVAEGAATKKQAVVPAGIDLFIPPDEPDLLARALEQGVDQSMVTHTSTFVHLGPRSGISDVNRLFRGIRLGVVTWESIKSGEDALTSNKVQGMCTSSTFRRNLHDKGSKRLAKSMNGTCDSHAHKVKKTNVFDLTLSTKQGSKVLEIAEYTYSERCKKCGCTLDSREQFGLECWCLYASMWKACGRCFIPIQGNVNCQTCEKKIKQIKQIKQIKHEH